MPALQIPLVDVAIVSLLLRFAVDLCVVSLLILYIYFTSQRNRTYVFAFIVMNVLVFFLCFTLKKLDLNLGMALGLFAIFGILRFRTDSIRIKEMTYLFVAVGVAVINALSNESTSVAELVLANGAILITTWTLERFSTAPIATSSSQNLVYDRLDLLGPDKKAQLIADVSERTGLDVTEVQVKKIDLKTQTATISALYEPQDDNATTQGDT